jgi:hypothetical protein
MPKHPPAHYINRYFSSKDGFGCHYALQDITEGELITTNYIAQEHALLSTPAR